MERKAKHPRAAATYRGARRNADRVKGWPEATFAKQRPLTASRYIPLNRSARWRHADSYAQAREMSPSARSVC